MLSSITYSESILWDLVVFVNVENTPILKNEDLRISGQVVDHAGKPVTNTTIHIKSSQNTTFVTTDESGKFSHVMKHQLLPGEHTINVVATSDGQIGLASKNFLVKGELRASDHTVKILETKDAKKYLNSKLEDFENDPVGKILYNHYQKLQLKFIKEETIQNSIDNARMELDNTRYISENITQGIINDTNPGTGTFSGLKYDIFVANLDPSVSEIITRQINFTMNVFSNAQKVMNDVLENNGTYHEARMAYLSESAISREMMDMVTYGNQTLETNATNTLNLNSTYVSDSINVINSTIMDSTLLDKQHTNQTSININGTQIQIGMSSTVIFLNINGTLVEFFINGTSIIQVTNTTNN